MLLCKRKRKWRKRGGFNPSGGSVNHGEDVGVASGNGKGANNVHVNMGKTRILEWEWQGEEGKHGSGILLFGKEDIGVIID
jgi:hypothetical protein